MRNRTWQLAIVSGLGIVVASILSYAMKSEAADPPAQPDMNKVTMAVAMVQGLGDHKVKGKVTFTQKSDGVEVVAELTGLHSGEHGFHIHEFGDCSMADGKCAGGHFNPTGAPHGGPDNPKRHVGDLGNIKADSTGNATYKRIDTMIALSGPHSIIGRAVILHAKPDDMKTQPTGDAGDRIGCGVIGIADPKIMH